MDQFQKTELGEYCVTGIPGIDAQHKELFSKIYAFQNLLKGENPSKDSVDAAVQAMLVHLHSHFSTEENLMEMISFPRAAEHIKLHQNFIDTIKGITNDSAGVDYLKICDLLTAFRSDVLAHIDVNDRDYVSYIEDLLAARRRFGVTAIGARAIAG